MVRARIKKTSGTLSRHLASLLNTVVTPDMRELYGRSARQGATTRNPVIVIPGILGSRLIDPESEKILWGGKTRAGFADQNDPKQARQVAHPMGLDQPLHELVDEIRPDGSVQRLRASRFGLSLQVKAYENIMRTLGVGGYLSPETRPAKNMLDYGTDVLSKCFEFDYDWRRSLPENAILFGQMVEAVLRFARRESGCPKGMKCDVVAHSMGGLLLRYYLRYGKTLLPSNGEDREPTWEGAKHIEHVMLVGTPNAGSLNAVDKLTTGLKANVVMPGYDPAILGTMPSVYQLLPRGRHKCIIDAQNEEPIEDLLEPETWVSHKWGLANPDAESMLKKLLPDASSAAERRSIALDHLAKCLDEAKRFHRAIDKPADPPAGVILQLFAGDGMQTARLAEVGPGGKSFTVRETEVGDGTVLRSSALMDERVGNPWYPRLLTPIKWDNVTFIATDHMALTRHPTFVNNALYLLLEKPRPTCDFRSPAPAGFEAGVEHESMALPETEA
ncbi:MAG: hypothetical protein AAF333_12380 [Planctomycetota bacterium]